MKTMKEFMEQYGVAWYVFDKQSADKKEMEKKLMKKMLEVRKRQQREVDVKNPGELVSFFFGDMGYIEVEDEKQFLKKLEREELKRTFPEQLGDKLVIECEMDGDEDDDIWCRYMCALKEEEEEEDGFKRVLLEHYPELKLREIFEGEKPLKEKARVLEEEVMEWASEMYRVGFHRKIRHVLYPMMLEELER